MPAWEWVNGRCRRVGSRRSTAITVREDRVDIDDDFEVIHANQIASDSAGRIYETPRSPQKGRTMWTAGDSWGPQDNRDIALDETGAPYEEELSSEIYESRIFRQSGVKPLKQKKKSKVSVSQFKGW